MRVIFLSDVPGSGLAGELKEVKNGYARNFLIPKKLAVIATHDQLQRIESIRKAGEERRLKEEQDMRALAERLAQLSVTVTAKVGPTGRFYGAITSANIADELSRITERVIERRTVYLGEPIHEPGPYEAEVRLGHGISITLQVTAAGEGQTRAAPAAEAEAATVAAAPVAEAKTMADAEAEAAPVADVEAKPGAADEVNTEDA